MCMSDIQIPINNPERGHVLHLSLEGILTLPEKNPKGIVVFAHSSVVVGRHSPRNQYVASVLNNSGRQIKELDPSRFFFFFK